METTSEERDFVMGRMEILRGSQRATIDVAFARRLCRDVDTLVGALGALDACLDFSTRVAGPMEFGSYDRLNEAFAEARAVLGEDA